MTPGCEEAPKLWQVQNLPPEIQLADPVHMPPPRPGNAGRQPPTPWLSDDPNPEPWGKNGVVTD